MLQVKKWFAGIILISLPVCFAAGWLVGLSHSQEADYLSGYIDGRNGLRLMKPEHFTIIGAGADTPVIGGQRERTH